jgi:iron complex transport system substrate-binding protein
MVSRALVLLGLVWTGAVGAAALELRDDAGGVHRLAAPATRVVTLAPHLAELVHAAGAGDLLVAVSEYSDFPAAVRELPRVGDAFRVDLERLVALRPELIIVWGSGNPQALQDRVAGLGVPMLVFEPRELADVARHLELIGRATGRDAAARTAATRYRERLAALRAAHAGAAPLSVFYQISDQPLYTVNGQHPISQMLSLCGGRNVFAGLGPLAPVVSEEAVVQADPEVIITGSQPVAELARRWGRWPGLRAAAGGLHSVDADLVARVTPRVLDGIVALCAALDATRAARTPR